MTAAATESKAQSPKPTDRFGNPIDPIVGFARGTIIQSSVDEARRLRQGQVVAADRVRKLGPHSIGVFTGNQRDFPLKPEDLATLCEEWVGPGLFANDLREVAIAHLGGKSEDGVAVFNRTSAGIIASIAALAGGSSVVSVVPPGGRSHASVIRGCAIARVELVEIGGDRDWRAALANAKPQLVVITTVTSALELLDDAITSAVVEASHAAGGIVLVDDAYGARLRPVLHGGKPGLALGADLAITNCDKAGLAGPRAGVLAGRANLVTAASAKGAEFGMEARAPIAAGAMRSLQSFRPEDLREEARSGQALAVALAEKLGRDFVSVSDLGPMVDEQDVLALVLRRAGRSAENFGLVPCEVSSALGMVLLRDAGILTVNTHGQPGARVSLRLKPTLDAMGRVGGQDAVVAAIDAALDYLAARIDEVTTISRLILGDQA
ncbi:aminotransferase class I/II-fold pyridoxal phosphate-dependent enzyme [Bradyrhizobium sp. ORS 111]|uniref:aminotransferase class I/II-fold pyridoxal phosphate-dependent enzyme n=1 Tax=Bradyrhizobium sp. ORS 111 TaxID=1685958 RepID=UPI00388DC19E